MWALCEMRADLDQRQWMQLSQAIREGKCIIFLGPGATVNFGAPLRQTQFFEEIASKNPKDILAYHPQDGFLVFKDTKTRSLYESEIRDFYQAKVANPLLEKLAQIPFSVIITVTPDQYIKTAFDAQNFAYFDQHYATKVKVPLREIPTAQRPLLYNLAGCVKEPHTIITSHADLFSYMQSIFGDKNLPDELTTLFNSEKTKSIVFLGFEFDKWYFQLDPVCPWNQKIDSCRRWSVMQSLPLAQKQNAGRVSIRDSVCGRRLGRLRRQYDCPIRPVRAPKTDRPESCSGQIPCWKCHEIFGEGIFGDRFRGLLPH